MKNVFFQHTLHRPRRSLNQPPTIAISSFIAMCWWLSIFPPSGIYLTWPHHFGSAAPASPLTGSGLEAPALGAPPGPRRPCPDHAPHPPQTSDLHFLSKPSLPLCFPTLLTLPTYISSPNLHFLCVFLHVLHTSNLHVLSEPSLPLCFPTRFTHFQLPTYISSPNLHFLCVFPVFSYASYTSPNNTEPPSATSTTLTPPFQCG